MIGILVAGIGLLGLGPFAMSWVYFRCARDARRHERWRAPALAGFVLALVPPLGAQLLTDRTVAHGLGLIEAEAPAERERGIELLRLVRPLHAFDELVLSYQREEDPDRKQRLAGAFRGVTGREVEAYLEASD